MAFSQFHIQIFRKVELALIRARARKFKYLYLPSFLLAIVVGAGVLTFPSFLAVADVPPAVRLAGPNGVVAPNSRTGMVYGIAFSPDGLTLAAGNDASDLKLWDAEKSTLKQVLSGHQGIIHDVAFSDDGATILSGSTLYHKNAGYLTGGEAKVWDAKTGKLQHSLSWLDFYVRNVALAGDGKTMAIGGLRSTKEKSSTNVELYEVQTGRLLHRLVQRPDAMYDVSSLIFSPDGKWVVTSLRDGIRIWNAQTGQLQTHIAHQGGILAQPIAVSPDGQILATTYENVVEMYDLATGRFASKVEVPEQMIGLGLDTLIFLSNDRLVGKSAFDLYSWELKPTVTRRILRHYVMDDAVISRDGQKMAGKSNNALMLQKIDWTDAKIVSN